MLSHRQTINLLGSRLKRQADFCRLILSEVYSHFRKVNCFNLAAALAYTTLLSLVPLLVVVISVVSALPLFETVNDRIMGFVFHNFVPSTGETVRQYLNEFASHAENMTGVGLFFLVLTAFLLMHSVHEIINEIWQVEESRALYYAVVLYALVLTLGPVLVASGTLISLALSSYFVGIPIIGKLMLWGSGLRHLFPLLLCVLGFTLVYKFVPNATVRFKHALIGGVLAAMLLAGASRVFSWYIAMFPAYKILYGALSAIPIFLIWVYISWIIILSGAVTVYCIGKARQGQSA